MVKATDIDISCNNTWEYRTTLEIYLSTVESKKEFESFWRNWKYEKYDNI